MASTRYDLGGQPPDPERERKELIEHFMNALEEAERAQAAADAQLLAELRNALRGRDDLHP